jgi:hypothetical protein
MQHNAGSLRRRPWGMRALSLLMAACLLLGLAPALISGASAAHWAAPYLDQLVDWGFLRADQSIDPDRPLTRAEFMAIVNRAYGYSKVGAMPFTDVPKSAWYYDDVAIAYNANYIQGTSKNTASPTAALTREQAVYILGRNMRLKETSGETLDFSDSRNISNWSQGMVHSAVDHYIVTGYADGSFRPQNAVARSEMAALMHRSIGTPLQKAGDYSLGGVFGNVTITSSGVVLRDTTISGDLYITGGVRLGNVRLENVTVLGRIITSGAGESEKGDVSLVMRNVVAQELLVDNMQNQYVSLRTEGITEIAKTTVRTSAYLQNNTPAGLGLKLIRLDGASGVSLSLAGRIGEVVNVSPGSSVLAAKGTIQKLTVDELATGSKVQIDRGAEVKELNLDVGTQVSGLGDVKVLNVNIAASTVTMLPDQITVRPGITANISGQQMDATAAEEASREPRLQSGYPIAVDVAPSSFSASFAANKKGTIYWAVSAVADGSVGADALILPPAYGAAAVKNGNVSTPTANTVVQAKVTGLTVGGSYYLSAVLVDARGERSPVKVAAFTTPDNSKPDFASGYPYLSRVTDSEAQVTVMPTKSCKLYYALLPKSATAPTANELKSNAVTGNLGYGVRDVIKNTEDSFTVNDKLLQELASYDLYLWLSDVDGANSSAVKKVSFATVDKTPPYFVLDPFANKVQATSVGLSFTINEVGTVYWAAVPAGTDYPKPKPGETSISPDDPYAILQVASGLNALKSGTVSATANREGTISISGLEKEKAYDLWYLAQDKAGNYSVTVKKLTIHTLDDTPPTVRQYFTNYSGTDNTQNPSTGTDIVLEFSEGVRSSVIGDGDSFLALYEAVARASSETAKKNAQVKLSTALQNTIRLYHDKGSGAPAVVVSRNDSNETSIGDKWVIDYRNATVTSRDGKVLVTFPTKPGKESALNLASGATYYFELKDITDTSNRQNLIIPNPVSYTSPASAGHKIPRFTTVFAQMFLSNPPEVSGNPPVKQNGNGTDTARIDLSFRMVPMSTSKVDDSISYDLVLWSDTIVEYDLYYRVVDKDGKPATLSSLPPNSSAKPIDGNGWMFLGASGAVNPSQGQLAGRSLSNHFNGCASNNFPKLNALKENLYYEFAISLTRMGTSSDFATWSGQVNFKFQAAAGTSSTLYTLSQGLSTQSWQEFKNNGLNGGGIVSVGISASSQDYLQVRQLFTDTKTPIFVSASPSFAVGDTFVTMSLNLDRKGTVYYVIAPAGKDGSNPLVTTTGTNGYPIVWGDVPSSGQTSALSLTLPDKLNIYQPPYSNVLIKTGSVTYPGGQAAFEKLVQGLEPKTDYYTYFVLKGAAQDVSPVYLYKFTTSDISKPKIELDRYTGIVDVKTQVDSNLNYIIFTANDLDKVSQFKTNLAANTAYSGRIPSKYAGMNIITAMLTTYNDNTAKENNTVTNAFIPDGDYNGYSVFDVYANDSIKATVAQIIRSGASASSSTASGNITTAANQKKTVDETRRMTPLTSHYFLSVAHHEASQPRIGDAFKAVDNVTLPDQIPPELTSASTVISTATGPFSGSVTITFDKNLYWSPGTVQEVAKPVYATSKVATIENDWVSVLQYLGGSARSSLTILSTVNSPGRSFTLSFSGLNVGDQIILFNNGLVSNSSGYTTQKTLTLTLKERTAKNDSGLPIKFYEFEANWGGKIIN